MFELTIEETFSAAHKLSTTQTKCAQLHGHNWKVELTVGAERLNKDGMVIDFEILKKMLKEVLSELDHGYLNEIQPFSERHPTSEEIARYIYGQTKKRLESIGIITLAVRVWENENSSVKYFERNAF